jgi:hypothetical protein
METDLGKTTISSNLTIMSQTLRRAPADPDHGRLLTVD